MTVLGLSLLRSYCKFCLSVYVQLVDGHTLFDYNVGLNEIIQILIRSSAALQTAVHADTESTTQTDVCSISENSDTQETSAKVCHK